MKYFLGFCLLLACDAASAQIPYTREYIFVAPTWQSARGSPASTYGAGLGIERLFTNGFGVGVDLAAEIPGRGKANQTIGLASLGGYYHFARKAQALDPFVAAGYSVLFRDFAANGYHLGLGLAYWLQDNRGLLVEVRRQQGISQPRPQVIYTEFRIGLTFR
jgi:hypothetical protein